MQEKNHSNSHGLFEAISQLFGATPLPDKAGQSVATRVDSLSEMEKAFNVALQQLDSKIEQLSRQQPKKESGGREISPLAAAEERERRMQLTRARIGQDILTMHVKLNTGIERLDLDALAEFLRECAAKVVEGKGSQEVMSCCRGSILQRFHLEAGKVAWTELETRLTAAGEAWPETTQRDPIEDAAAFESRRQLRYSEISGTFVNYDISRSVELILGFERAWKAGYPEPETPLWRELVLEGVATALRARILRGYFDLLVGKKEEIVARAAELVGQELKLLRTALAGNTLATLEDAHRVAKSSSRVIDEVIPEIAWQVIRRKEATG